MAGTTGTSGDDHLNGGSGNDTLLGLAGDDRLNGGSGSDTVDGGSGSDIVQGDSGDDILIYRAAENVGSTDIYDGGSGIDRLRLMLTSTEWMSPQVQQDVANYLLFIAGHTLPNGQANNGEFRFTAFDLRISKVETLEVFVNGVQIDPRDQAVTTANDAITTDEDHASVSINLLANDVVPDLVQSVVIVQGPIKGSISLTTDLSNVANPLANVVYTPGAALQSLAAGESTTDTFTYRVTDADGDTSLATVTVTIVGTNDAPTVSAAVTAAGNEGSGTFSVNLLQNASDVDHGAVLHIANLVWTDTGIGLPAGFSISGNSIVVDTNSLAYNAMAQGETFATHFAYDVVDEHGALVHQTATITITGTNDAPTVSAAVTGGGAEGSGLASVNLLNFASDVDNGAVLHIANIVWTEVPGHLPAGFSISPDGNSINVDTNSLAYNGLAQGETFTTHFSFDVVDEHGALVHQTATVTITGTNDAPLVTTEAGDSAGQTLAETNAGLQATGTLTASDVDISDVVTVSVVGVTHSGPTGGLTDTQLLSYFGVTAGPIDTPTTTSDHFTWNFNSGGQAFDFLAVGETLTLHYTIRPDDGHSPPPIGDGVVTIHITGTNDAPVITSGPGSGTVIENAPVSFVSGTMTAFDPDNGAELLWTVSGGTPAEAADYHFVMDNLHIIKNGGAFFDDDFADGLAPPNSPNFASGTPTNYFVSGGFQESGGKLIIDSADAIPVVSIGTTDPFIGNHALVLSNIDPADLVRGLKNDDNFTVEGRFDLIMPGSREVYGIRLSDRHIGGNGTPPDQFGDDLIELVVRRGQDGIVRVQLRELDIVNDQVTNIQGIVLNAPLGADQIVLRLTHSTSDVGALHASFDYLAGGIVIGSTTNFAQVGRIFGTETPGFTGDDENWTRAQIVTYAPAITDSTLAGAYGSLTIGQNGTWTYNLANNQTNVQNLAQGQTVFDTFTVQITDEHGASDTETITITVTGTNDAPVITTPAVSRALAEDSATPTLTETGLSFFFDIDLTDTHTVAPSLMSATLSDGGSVPGGVLASLGGALTTTIIDPATGDTDGHLRWDFALANAAAQFLAVGQSLTAVYRITVTDTFLATSTQNVTITITGTNDAPVITSPQGSASFTEVPNVTGDFFGAAITAASFLSYTDVDLNDTHSVSHALVSVAYSAGLPVPALALLGLGSFATTIEPAYDSTGTGFGNLFWSLGFPDAFVDFLAQGEVLTATYQIVVTDNHGASSLPQDVIMTIAGSNDAPLVTAEAGDSAGQTLAETNAGLQATGTLTASDVDTSDVVTVSVAGVTHSGSTGGLTDAQLLSFFNVMSGAIDTAITTSGQLTWNFNSGAQAFNFLAVDETLTLHYTIRPDDGHSPPAIGDGVVTIHITGTNDTPVITSGPGSGAVVENGALTATGTMVAVDPDNGAQKFWTVSGGTPAQAADYHFVMDNFKVTKNGNPFFEDPFSDGLAPPNSPNFANGNPTTYFNNGAFTETGGKLIIDSSGAAPVLSIGTPDPFVGNLALVTSFIGPDLTRGLRNTDNFTVEGVFDLILPDSPREVYGIRLMDRLVGGGGTPPDQLGDDLIELVVRQGQDGIVRVQLRELDIVNDQTINIGALVLAPPPGADQILLRLTHSTTDVGAVHASFDYLEGGVVVGSQSLAQIGRIFGTETPGFTGDDENWTRAQIVAYAPAITDSTLAGAYGTLTIGQNGAWAYNLANNQLNVQNLAAGETVVDTFTVQVTDEHGASDTEVINITVTGSNDAPVVVTGPVTRSLAEDSAPTLTAMGDAFFFDLDLSDTHTITPSLLSATLSTGGPIAPGLQAALASALTTSLIDPATGDSDGQYRWDFALDNAAAQFLGNGETLTLVYNVTATDNHGASSTQPVTITFTGTNDAPTNSIGFADGGTVVQYAPGSPGAGTGLHTTFDDTHAAGGGFWVYDADVTDTHTASVAALTTGNLSTVVATSVDNQAPGVDFLNWTFSVPDSSFAYLGEGETKTEIFRVSAVDPYGAETHRDISIVLTGVNDAPEFTDADDIFDFGPINENQAAGVLVGLVTATDVDASDVVRYSITSGNTSGLFAIDELTGVITTTGALDFEAASSYALTVQARDRATGGLTDMAVVNVGVGDVAESSGPITVAIVFSNLTDAVTLTKNQLENSTSFDFNVDLVAYNSINFAAPATYDVIIQGGEYYDSFSPQYWTYLQQAHAAGTGVLTMGHFDYELNFYIPAGSKAAADSISPIAMSRDNFVWNSTLTGVDSSHLITQGITSIPHPNSVWQGAEFIDPGAQALAIQTGPSNMGGFVTGAAIAIADPGSSGREVYLGAHYLEANYDNIEYRSGVHDQILERTVVWLADVDNLLI